MNNKRQRRQFIVMFIALGIGLIIIAIIFGISKLIEATTDSLNTTQVAYATNIRATLDEYTIQQQQTLEGLAAATATQFILAPTQTFEANSTATIIAQANAATQTAFYNIENEKNFIATQTGVATLIARQTQEIASTQTTSAIETVISAATQAALPTPTPCIDRLNSGTIYTFPDTLYAPALPGSVSGDIIVLRALNDGSWFNINFKQSDGQPISGWILRETIQFQCANDPPVMDNFNFRDLPLIFGDRFDSRNPQWPVNNDYDVSGGILATNRTNYTEIALNAIQLPASYRIDLRIRIPPPFETDRPRAGILLNVGGSSYYEAAVGGPNCTVYLNEYDASQTMGEDDSPQQPLSREQDCSISDWILLSIEQKAADLSLYLNDKFVLAAPIQAVGGGSFRLFAYRGKKTDNLGIARAEFDNLYVWNLDVSGNSLTTETSEP